MTYLKKQNGIIIKYLKVELVHKKEAIIMNEEREKLVNEFVTAFNEWKAKIDKILKENNIENENVKIYDNEDYDNDVIDLLTINDIVVQGKDIKDIINIREGNNDNYAYLFDIEAILKNHTMEKTQYLLYDNIMYIWHETDTKWENL